ncbi:hypothetical protein PN434_17965 [Microcystis aeruginosa CS-558/01A06]|nr:MULTISPECIES: hypothetical protein [Microcystis]MDB9410374.1 hypothetical protein [Microcystis aeruginosa CS-558/01A06]
MGKPSEKKQENRWKWWDDFKKRNDSKKKQENRWKWWNDEENLKSIEYYGLIDQEIHREHNLIANRMNWYVTSQSFLMAAFAISGNNNYRLGFLSISLPILGIVTSFIIGVSLYAAIAAMALLKTEKKRILKQDKYLGNISTFKARFVDNEHTWIHRWGIFPARSIPVLFFIFWFIFLYLATQTKIC